MLQVTFLWVGLRSLVAEAVWLAVLGVVLCMLVLIAVYVVLMDRAYRQQYALADSDDASFVSTLRLNKDLILAAGFLFLFNAVPNADVQVSNFEYFAFENHRCRLQYLGLVGTTASLAASLTYGAVLSRRPLSRTLILTAIFAGVASLMSLPFVRLDRLIACYLFVFFF